jgi:hypothetical protein
VQVLSATLGAVFAHVARDPSEDVNTQLLASSVPVTGAAIARAVPDLPPALRPIAAAAAARLAPPLRGGRVYTDDVAPVEWLVDTSLLKVAADGHQ